MTAIVTDRRKVEATFDPEWERRVRETAAEYLDVRFRMARLLFEGGRERKFVPAGCASITEYAHLLSIPRNEARMLVDLGVALEAPVAPPPPPPPAKAGPGDAAAPDEPPTPPAAPAPPAPSVEERVRAGRVPIENAILLGRIVDKPGATKAGEDWVRDAETMAPSQFRQKVNGRLEELAQREPTIPCTLHVKGTTLDAFRRARAVASERAQTPLTEGETFAVVVNHYLDCCDVMRRGEGERRVPDTSERPGDRYIPAAVKRAVRERSGNRCEFGACVHCMFLQFVHVKPHEQRGNREATNILHGCDPHHTLFDAGRIIFAGWKDGHPVLRNDRGELLGQPGGEVSKLAGPPPAAPAPSEAADEPGPREYEVPEEHGEEGCDGAGPASERPPPA